MKMVVAMIENDRLKQAQSRLEDMGITGYTISATIGAGEHSGKSFAVGMRQHLKIEVATPDMWVDSVVDALRSAAGAGASGVIFVYTLDRAVKIRTGDEGEGFLMPN